MITELRTVGEPQPEPKPFPKLMRSSKGQIILFTGRSEGTVIKEGFGTIWPVGDYSTKWVMENFTDLPTNEEVVLRNS